MELDVPAVSRIGDTGSGHDACPATTLTSGSGDTFVNNISVSRVSDTLEEHSCPAHSSHQRTVSSGSSSVFVNNLPAARIGDPIDCGGLLVQGSGNTFFG